MELEAVNYSHLDPRTVSPVCFQQSSRLLLGRHWSAGTGIPQNTDHHWLLVLEASVLVVDDVLWIPDPAIFFSHPRAFEVANTRTNPQAQLQQRITEKSTV